VKLGITAAPFGPEAKLNLDFIRLAESLGFESAWTAEAYGNDAVTTAAWILASTTKLKVGTAIMQIPARTPAMTAMTAMTLDNLSGGRFILGLGPSGPQVVEGWHGVPYGKPLTRSRETIAIIRQILSREKPLEFRGEHYTIPASGPGTTGLGKPLKSILHGNPNMKIYTASIGPAGLKMAAEVADGVFPMMVIPEKFEKVQLPHLQEGFKAAGGGKSIADFAVVPGVSVVVNDDLQKARDAVKPGTALYVGGMGARGKNFYNDHAKRLGFEAAAVKIQDLYLAGKRNEAIAAVPDELIDEIALVGPKARIKERLQAWKEAGRKGYVHTMQIGSGQPEALKLLAEELL
jgi:F420-dependent oxidoreductase-like protein